MQELIHQVGTFLFSAAAAAQEPGIAGQLGALLRDAILRTVEVSQIAGVKALLVHAISEAAADFYESQGFHRSPITPNTLFLPLSEV